MVAASYISIIDRYHEYRGAIRELLGSILSGIDQARLCGEPASLAATFCAVREHYPFVELIYTLDDNGTQSSPNVDCAAARGLKKNNGLGMDRSQRPYYRLAREAEACVVTEPYLSSASRNLCISAAAKCLDADGGIIGYIVLDIDLSRTIEFFMGDAARRRFAPAFRVVYSLIVVGLFSVVGLLLYSAFADVLEVLQGEVSDMEIHPFGIVIFLTLALAIFDLGKTILEEEVLMHKDIFRHSSTRRTITRFVAAILIAVSIEALLMMFKSALGEADHMLEAVWMMLTAIGLLVGLGIYVYLGAQAEVALRNQKVVGGR